MKKLFTFVITIVMMLIFPEVIHADDQIKVRVNNELIECPNPPVAKDGRILVPLRALSEAMGCECVWVPSGQYANIQNDTVLISVQLNNKYISKQKRVSADTSSVIEADVPACAINGSIYIPVRAVAEAFDAVVGWDPASKTVVVVFDTSLNYKGGYTVETFAGTGERKKHDSSLSTMAFVDPEGIAVNSKGDFIVSDSGMLRKLSNGKSETIEFEPSYITASLVRCYGNDLYVLTNEFVDSSGVKYYGIVKLTDAGAEGVFVTEATYSTITDFDISKDGKLYVVYNNLGVGKTYLGELDLVNSDINYITELDSGIKTLAVDDNGNVFLGNTVKGSLYFYDIDSKKLKLFAGVNEKIKFVDGPNPMFFEPRRLAYENDYLYVLDYNVVRRISIDSANQAIAAETLAGKVSAEQHPETVNGRGSDVIFAPSYLMDMVVIGDDVYLTDPKNAVIRYIHN